MMPTPSRTASRIYRDEFTLRKRITTHWFLDGLRVGLSWQWSVSLLRFRELLAWVFPVGVHVAGC